MGGAPDRTVLLQPDLAKDPAGVSCVSDASDVSDVSDVSDDPKESNEPTNSGGSTEACESNEPAIVTGPRTILVDGFNVLHAVLLGKDRADGWWRRRHRERLLERLCEWRGGPDRIWVAFDGTRPAESIWAEPVAIVAPPPIFRPQSESPTEGQSAAQTEGETAIQSQDRTRRASTGTPQGPTIHTVFVESADDWIVRRARRAEDPSRLIVVSADRKVAGRARSAGCEILTPWTFMRGCGPAPVHDPVENGAAEHAAPETEPREPNRQVSES